MSYINKLPLFIILIIYETLNKNWGAKNYYSQLNKGIYPRLLNVKCRAGESLTYDYKCDKCKEGFFNFSRDNKKCSPCPIGTFSSYVGSIICENCPYGSTTKSIGSKSISDCVCNKGFKLSSYLNGGNKCVPCNSQEYCKSNENTWCFRNMCLKDKNKENIKLCKKVKKKSIYNYEILCFKKGVCLNVKEKNSCLEGNKMIQCKICDENYRYNFIAPLQQPCVLCNMSTYFIIFFFAIFIFVISIFIAMCINNEKEKSIIQLFFTYIQFVSLLRYVNSNYDHYLVKFLYFFTFGIPINEFLDCVFKRGSNLERIQKKITFLLYLPLLILICSLLCTFVITLFYKNVKRREDVTICPFDKNYKQRSKKKHINKVDNSNVNNNNISEYKKKKDCSKRNEINIIDMNDRKEMNFCDSNNLFINEISQPKKFHHNIYSDDNITRCNLFSAENYVRSFLFFFIFYHDLIYIEIIKLCVLFCLCNYDEHREESFIIIDDSINCEDMKSSYYKIMIIIIYNTFMKFFYLKYVKRYQAVIDEYIILQQKAKIINKKDTLFLIIFIILFHKKFWITINPSLYYNYKNGLYNNNIHIFQKRKKKKKNVSNTRDCFDNDEGNKMCHMKLYSSCRIRNNKSNICHSVEKNNIKEYDKKEKEITNKRNNMWYHFFIILFQNVKKKDTFLYSFSCLIYTTILLFYYTFLCYVHIKNFIKIITIISILCNITIYFVFILFFLINHTIKKYNFSKKIIYIISFVKKRKRKWLGIYRKFKTLIWGNRKKMEDTYSRVKNKKGIENEQKKEQKLKSLLLMSNVLNYYTDDEESILNTKNNNVKKKNNNIFMVKKWNVNNIKRHKLLNISEIWIHYLYNIISLSNEPQKCLSILIKLTLEKKYPLISLKTCIHVLRKNHFFETDNFLIILKNFLKFTKKFVKVLRRKKYEQSYEYLIIYAWGMSILNYGNLRDINYNISHILFHVYSILNKCRFYKNIVEHFFNIYPYVNNNAMKGNMSLINMYNNMCNFSFDKNNLYEEEKQSQKIKNNILIEQNFLDDNVNMDIKDDPCDEIEDMNMLQMYGNSFCQSFMPLYNHNFNRKNDQSIHMEETYMCDRERFNCLDKYMCSNTYINKRNNETFVNAHKGEYKYDISSDMNLIDYKKQSTRTKNFKGQRIFYHMHSLYIIELARIFIHCLLLDVSEFFFKIYHTHICEKYICNNLINLWGCYRNQNIYMKRFFEYIKKGEYKNQQNIIRYNICSIINEKRDDNNNNIDNTDNIDNILSITDFINKKVLDIDFYNEYEKLSKNSKHYFINISEEKDYLNINELINFSKASDNIEELKRLQNNLIEKRNKKKLKIFSLIFCSAMPVHIIDDYEMYLDEDDIKLIKERKRNFNILLENMSEQIMDQYVKENYNDKKYYFEMCNYGSSLNIRGEFLEAYSKKIVSEKNKNNIKELKTNIIDIKHIYNKGDDEDTDNLLNIKYIDILNKNKNDYMNYQYIKEYNSLLLIHNNYKGCVGITGDLKGMNFYHSNASIIINPCIPLPTECTIELWLCCNPKKKYRNISGKKFAFCDKKGNSLFVLSLNEDGLEDIEIYITNVELLSDYYKKMNYIQDIKTATHYHRLKDISKVLNYNNGIYIKSNMITKKCKKYKKYKIYKIYKIGKNYNMRNNIIKKKKWNLINITKSSQGLVYYINGKYISFISHEILNMQKTFEICLFGNSCFGNNNIGICSSFKIFNFLNKEEIKCRYKIIKNIKCKEMLGDNIKIQDDNNNNNNNYNYYNYNNFVIEGIDVRETKPAEIIFLINFIQSSKYTNRVIPFINDSNYMLKIYQLKFFDIYKNNINLSNMNYYEDICDKYNDFSEGTKKHIIHHNSNQNISCWQEEKSKNVDMVKKKNIYINYNNDDNIINNYSSIDCRIIHIKNKDHYGYNVYVKKIIGRQDVPKIYGINIFSHNFGLACDLSKFYNLIISPSLSIYNELQKTLGYSICAWIFLPIEKSISYSSLIAGKKDIHVCIFSDDMLLGSIQNYTSKGNLLFYHSSGYSIKNMKRGWYYLNVIGTLQGQYYFLNGKFKGYHTFCSFDNIKYICNSSLFINPFPYICFLKILNKPLSMNEVLYEFYTFSKLFNETSYESYNLHYIIHFLFPYFESKNKNNISYSSNDTSLCNSYDHNCSEGKYLHFYITENYDVHIYPIEQVKNYYYSVSLISIKNRKLYYFNSINEQSNNLNIHLKNYIILPEHHWTILAVINLTHINKLGYHCLVGGTNGNSHICINGFDLSIGVLINLQNEYIYEEQLSLEDSFTSISDTLNGFSLLNEYMKVDSITKEKNNNNNDDDDDLLCNSYDKKINKYNNNVSDFDNVHIRNANKSYSTFCGCGYNLQNELNKNILITTTCRNYEQTFFINSTKVGITQACLDPITCIGNCASINNEFLSPFGSYKFLRIIFDYVSDEQIRQFYYSLKL
ncbi:hypothetical protein PFTANZ_02397 [Plasmodium falciparum Tanzania (2000708)]|uniref:Tyrosine-protein kinase ephrin type A/B receptor-like domain-containing protein n=1 Tax=Plasmodium falciparum Tanzania (2000708) TaxID=1036725 RepID=A0A024W8B3_PLAFA|nr:hypothetical protein PFTANZ_02397 [Plasmodium falciparum Tanzania (2000708)]